MTTATNLRQVPLVQRYLNLTWLTLGVAALIMVWAAFAQPAILLNTLVTCGMWAIMAAGLALIFGIMNIPNFAHGELFLVGSFTAFTVFSPIQYASLANPSAVVLKCLRPFPGMVAAVGVGALAGLILEVLLFRPLRRRSREPWVMNTFLLTAGVVMGLINGDPLGFGNDLPGVPHY